MNLEQLKSVDQEIAFIGQLKFDHSLWMNHLSFLKREINLYQERLEQLLVKFGNDNNRPDFDEQQNGLCLEVESIEGLEHHIQIHQRYIEGFKNDTAVALNDHFFMDHMKTQSEMESFLANYENQRQKFNRFVNHLIHAQG